MKKVLILLGIISIFGCATTNQKYDELTLCPDGSKKDNAGELFEITNLNENYLSLWKDRWPWEKSHLGKYSKEKPILELVCIEPTVSSKGYKQRNVVYKVKGTSDYIFGKAKYGTIQTGVVAKSFIDEVKKLEGKKVWFGYKTKGSSYQQLKNLTPYTVSRVDLGTQITDKRDLYIVVQDKGIDVRVPISKDKKGNLTVPGKVLFVEEPTAKSLNLGTSPL